MVLVNYSEVINLEQFSQISQISTIANFQLQVLPHGQHQISFSQNNQPRIQFLVKEIENNPWKLADYEFTLAPDKKSNEDNVQFHFKNQIDNQGNLILLYSIFNSGSMNSPLYYTSSHNYGKTWINPTQISPEGENWIPSGNLVMLEIGYNVGGLQVPVYNPTVNRMLCLTSKDNGKEWNFSLYVEPFDGILENLDEGNDLLFSSVGTKNGHVCELQDGRLFLFCYVQTSKDLHLAISKDVGATWSEASPIDNFPGTEMGTFDCLNLLEPDNFADNLFFLGNQQVENQFQLVLWKYNTIENQFDEVWTHSGLFKNPITQLHLFKEDNYIFHITFLSPEQKIYHYEISKS
ncbi:MAG: sialidase family protein [Promethearchaeota archaeon]